MGPFETTSGIVVTFDEHRGYGTVADTEGSEWPFHCTAVADQTRTIAVGAVVAFELVPGRLGRWEATNLRPG